MRPFRLALLALAVASAAQATPRAYRCTSDHGLSVFEGVIKPDRSFDSIFGDFPKERHLVSLYPWGAVISFDGTGARVAKDKSGLPDAAFGECAQAPGPNFQTAATPECVFKADDGASIEQNITRSVQACMTKTAVVDTKSVRHNYGLVVHPDLLAGKPSQDKKGVPGFTLMWYQPAKTAGRYLKMVEDFSCERVK
jgi:hypothetical protein